MIDLIKKGVFLGLGALTLTKEKAEELVDELIKKGEVSKDERYNLMREILDKAKEQEENINKRISVEIGKAIEKWGIPSKKDFEELEKRIDKLTQQLKGKK
jgi:polyhydroxyalkanoate synthesis regulator phasin